MNELTQTFIAKVIDRNELQRKYLDKWEATESEKQELDIILRFFLEELGYELDFIVNAYLFINQMAMEETYYFVQHGRYRNSSFEEVNKIVYDNSEYMEKYMIGLAISDYIWINHIKTLRYFVENINSFYGDRYLEIGPGFGQFLVKVLLYHKFKVYDACDVSKTSVNRCNKYLKYRGFSDRCVVVWKDFFEFSGSREYDCIVMGEVLEHVEQPALMLRKLHELLSQDGRSFVTTVINAPMIDHIALFESIEQVLTLVGEAGFTVLDYMCATEGDIPLQQAIIKKRAINIAMILKKK